MLLVEKTTQTYFSKLRDAYNWRITLCLVLSIAFLLFIRDLDALVLWHLQIRTVSVIAFSLGTLLFMLSFFCTPFFAYACYRLATIFVGYLLLQTKSAKTAD